MLVAGEGLPPTRHGNCTYRLLSRHSFFSYKTCTTSPSSKHSCTDARTVVHKVSGRPSWPANDRSRNWNVGFSRASRDDSCWSPNQSQLPHRAITEVRHCCSTSWFALTVPPVLALEPTRVCAREISTSCSPRNAHELLGRTFLTREQCNANSAWQLQCLTCNGQCIVVHTLRCQDAGQATQWSVQDIQHRRCAPRLDCTTLEKSSPFLWRRRGRRWCPHPP